MSHLGIRYFFALEAVSVAFLSYDWALSFTQAMALGALPSNLPTTLNNIGTMIDDVWYFAGDRSTDVCQFVFFYVSYVLLMVFFPTGYTM